MPVASSQRHLSPPPQPSHRQRLVRVLLAVLFTLAAASSRLAAQPTVTGQLLGVVVDDRGVPVRGAQLALVAAARADSAPDARGSSDDAGTFRFTVAPGAYRLRVQRLGFRPTLVTGVIVRGEQRTELRVSLQRAVAELAAVEVRAPAVTIRRRDTELGTVIGAEQLALLPVGLDARAIVAFTPGARPDVVWGGASAQANRYELDGVPLTHPGVGGPMLELSPSWIETLEVRGLGAGASAGDFQGGLIAVATRSGTNERRGALRSWIETHRWNDSNIGVAEAVQELAGRQVLEGEASGPVMRDRLFYFVSAQLLRHDSRAVDQLTGGASFSAAQEESREQKLFGKLSWRATPRDLVQLTVLHDGARTEHAGLNGFASPEATARRDSPSSLASLQWTRRSQRSALELSMSGVQSRQRLEPYASPAVPGLATFLPVDPRLYRNAIYAESSRARTLDVSAQWQVDVATGAIGHTIRAGGQHAVSDWLEDRTRNGGMTWQPAVTARNSANPFSPTSPASWFVNRIIPVATGGEVHVDAAMRSSALYAEDAIAVLPRLRIIPGVRLGRWAGDLRPASGGARLNAVRDGALDPRLGVVAELTGRGDLVAKAHWGRYHQGLFAQLFDRAAGGHTHDDELLWYYTGATPADPNHGYTSAEWSALQASGALHLVQDRILNESGSATEYRQPYMDQVALGLEKTFGGRWKAAARYVRRRNHDLVALVDRNAGANYTVFDDVLIRDNSGHVVRGVAGDTLRLPSLSIPNSAMLQFLREQAAGHHDGQSIPGFFPADTARLTWNPDYALEPAPGAVRRFDQLQLEVTGEIARWYTSGSVTLTRLVGNMATVTGYSDERGRGAGAWSHPNEQLNFFGPLDGVSELEAKLVATGALPWRLRGGLFFTFRSGDRVTPTLTLSNLLFTYSTSGDLPSLLVQPLTGQSQFAEARGHYRHPARSLLDLHLERPIGLGRADLVLSVDLFNTLGANAVTRSVTALDATLDPLATSSYGAVRAREAPRTLRLGTALVF